MTYNHLVVEGNNIMKGVSFQSSHAILKLGLTHYTYKGNCEVYNSGAEQCFGVTEHSLPM